MRLSCVPNTISSAKQNECPFLVMTSRITYAFSHQKLRMTNAGCGTSLPNGP
ncbi:hypothetical protein QJS04_geneDACA023958 [Acorus gramineus]|uniref:Uncharacterized protein n=1 Tax=Acorus gramineus TaxID=55184 RepID=A0AAV9B5Y6_ACOGR|nr:hypothetical protein QJS04_geneDACA023958 [Acorus gramineus]